jgi:outer membrane protein assembly factor BamB
MKAKKIFSGLLLLLALGIFCPGWGQAAYLTERWTFAGILDWHVGAVYGSPAVGDDGTIYAGAEPGYVLDLNPDGIMKGGMWMPGSPFITTAAITPDGYIIIHNGQTIYFIDPISGFPTCDASVDAGFQGAPAVSKEGTVYIGSGDGKLHAFAIYHEDPDYDEVGELWSFEVTLPEGSYTAKFSNPVIDLHGTIYCLYESLGEWSMDGAGGQGKSRLYAINPNGTLKTFRDLDGEINSDVSPAIGPDGTIYVAGADRLYALLPDNTLSIKWDKPMPGTPTGSPVIGVPVAAWDQYSIVVPYGGELQCIGSKGENYGTFQADPGFSPTTAAIGKSGYVYFGTSAPDQGQLCLLAFSQYEAILIDKVPMDGEIHSSPAIVPVGSQNVLYIDSQHSVSAWNINIGGVKSGLARTSWPCDRGNLKRNGRVSLAFSALYMVKALMASLGDFHLGNIAISLNAKLESAGQSLEKEDLIPARNKLNAFINEVSAQKGKKIMVRGAADSLIAGAQNIVRILQ